MSGVALAIGGGAVLGAVGSAYSAKQANKPKKGYTDQTTVQKPWLWDEGWGVEGDIGKILELQRGIVAGGVPQLGPGGVALQPRGGDGATAGAPPVPPGGTRRPDGRIIDASGDTVYTPPAGARSPVKGKRKGGGAPKALTGTTAAPAAPASAEDIFREVAKRGLETSSDPLVKQGSTAIGNILGAAGDGGPETTGYDQYNPISNTLAKGLMEEEENKVSRDLLLRFLGESGRGVGGAAAKPVGGNITIRPYSATAAIDPSTGRPLPATTMYPGATGGGAVTGAAAGIGGAPVHPAALAVPDTMAVPSFFGTETRKLFGEGPDPELDALIEAMRRETLEGHWEGLADIDAAAQGAGRFGGDTWQAARVGAQEELAEALAGQSAQVRVGDREARRQARLAALAGVSARDLAAMQNATNHEAIAAGERNAAASAGAAGAAASAGAATARELGLRAQDLNALGMLMEGERFGTGTLAGLGERLSLDRLAGVGMIPDLSGIGLSGLNLALGGGGGLTDLRDIASRERIAGQSANIARQGINQQAAMWNAGQAQQQVNQYLQNLLAIGGMGGVQTTRGTNVVPGAGISTGGAAATGALGGAATGMGLWDIYQRSAGR